MARGDIPGSSRRCDECKRRRKKCDLTEPRCLRCRKSGIACSGPNQSSIFINQTSTQAVQHRAQRPALARAYQHRHLASAWSREFHSSITEHVGQLQDLLSRYSFLSKISRNSQILAARVASESIYEHLLYEFEKRPSGLFSADRVNHARLQHYSTIAISIRGLLLLKHKQTVFDESLLNLLSMYYGSLHGHKTLAATAQSEYLSTLGRHRAGIARRRNPAVLFYNTAVMLAMEQLMTHDTDSFGTMAHAAGMLTLLQMLSPQWLSATPEAHGIYSGLKGIVIHQDISSRRPSILSDPAWLKALPERPQTMREQLLDIAFTIPSALQSADELLNGFTVSAVDQTLHLLLAFRNIQNSFKQWLSKLKDEVKDPLTFNRSYSGFTTMDNICTPDFVTPFNQVFFISGTIAGLLVHYWSFNLVLLRTMVDLENKLMETSPSRYVQFMVEADVSLHQSSAEQFAINVLEAVPYLSSCYEGVLCLKAPLKVAADYFDRWR